MAVTACSSVICNGDWSFYHSNGMKSCKVEVRRSRVNSVVVVAASSSAVRKSQADSYHMKEVKMARQKFTQEVSFAKKDKDVSLSRALLYIAAEDEAILSFHRDSDARSFSNELGRSEIGGEPELRSDDTEVLSFDGKSVFEWLDELDCIVREVEVDLVSRDVDCHLVQVLEAVNKILFKSRHFKRYPVLLDTKFSYLHSALSSGCSSAIVLSVIYIEVCRKLGIEMVGSRVGEDFLIWPKAQSLEELFEVSSGPNLFAVMNGRCVEDPRAKAYELSSKSLAGLEVATNRDIIGIALANLIRLYWKRASRMNRGLMLTSPLRPVSNVTADNRNVYTSKCPLLRPQELRLAIMASERLLILQPHNWALRRDHGMLLYYSRKYGEAVQELSICMAFAPMEEAEVLEPFVEKLHLMRIESSWNMLENSSLAVP